MAKSSPITLLQTTFDLTQTEHKDMWRNTRDRWKKSRLYLTVNADETKQKTVDEMFCERYYSPKIGLTKQIKKQFVNELNNLFPQQGYATCKEEDISLRWDRYAGCSCPCSPGYVITFNNWVNIPHWISKGGHFRVSIKI